MSGTHALHAVVAIIALTWVYVLMRRGTLAPSTFTSHAGVLVFCRYLVARNLLAGVPVKMYFGVIMRVTKPISILLAAAAACFSPAASWACAACAAGDPKTSGTYLGMTVMMSSLPLLIIGGLGYWLWRRHS